MTVRVLHGDMLTVLPTLDAASVDAVVTDPPYHLTTGKRGGTGIASLNVNSPAGRSRISTGFMGQTWDGGDIAMRVETWGKVFRVMKPGAHLVAFGGTRTYHRMACAIEDAGFEIRESLMWLYATGFPKSLDVSKAIDKMLGATPEAAQWQGWGSALKPAFEPIILARKPLDGTIAANVLKHGVGGINVDACRIDAEKPTGWSGRSRDAGDLTNYRMGKPGDPRPVDGRFPANVLHDGSDEVMEAFAAYGDRASKGGGGAPASGFWGNAGGCDGLVRNDTGSAARFFYSSKASADDRMGSKHPTVKPLSLLNWLVKLITPPGGTVLDPFAGSGTTLLAADRLQMHAIGIEQSAEFVADIHRRLQGDGGLFAEVTAA